MTSLTINLPDDVAAEVRRTADSRGTAAEEVAADVVRHRFELEVLLRPVRDAFEESGLTEDELGDLIEAEREAMHRERREAAGAAASDGTPKGIAV